MLLMRTRNWLTRLSNRPQRNERRPKPRLQLESLEDRCVPAAFTFSTGNPDGQMATASRPANGAAIEIESADDFILSNETVLNQATFTGLIPSAASVTQVVVEIYRVFPKDSNTVRTIKVPTRTNSPSDLIFNSRDSATSDLTFTTAVLNASFTANNSVQPGGIHSLPNQTTGGNGAVSGQETQFNVTFTTPLDLPADHYFFVPQVLLSTGNFFWLSAPKPIVSPGTPFVPDLQSWTRDANLAPDWLRIGTDIVGGTTPPNFNAAFSLSGTTLDLQTTGLSQTSATEGSSNLSLTVNGSNFTRASKVLFNGLPLATTFIDPGQLRALLPAVLLADEGNANVSVFDPQRGLSNAQTFTTTDSIPTIGAQVSPGLARNATIKGAFADQATEGHRVRINWGDGTFDILDQGVSSAGHFTASHKYRRIRPRTRTVTLTLFDDEGTSSGHLVFVIHFRRNGATFRHR